LIGRTGIWLLRTDGAVDEPDLNRHLKYLVSLIFESNESRAARLHEVLTRRKLEARVSCFLARLSRRSAAFDPRLGHRCFRAAAR
jgi:hypothetical protein